MPDTQTADKGDDLWRAPDDPDVKIWRYMDFAKFVAMLDSEALFFTRADLLGDPFEGSITQTDKEDMQAGWEDFPPELAKGISASVRRMPLDYYISCWHMNDHESAAMWTIYAKSAGAVAVQSTYRRLRDCLPTHINIGVVRYADYSSERVYNRRVVEPFLHKRKSFEHEKELRALLLIPAGRDIDANNPVYVGLKYLPRVEAYFEALGLQDPADFNPEEFYAFLREGGCPSGYTINVDLDRLVERLYVAPMAQAWFGELVKRVARKYDLKMPVVQSSLDSDPIF